MLKRLSQMADRRFHALLLKVVAAMRDRDKARASS